MQTFGEIIKERNLIGRKWMIEKRKGRENEKAENKGRGKEVSAVKKKIEGTLNKTEKVQINWKKRHYER